MSSRKDPFGGFLKLGELLKDNTYGTTELALSLADRLFTSAGNRVARAAGVSRPARVTSPPVQGPATLDHAVSEIANTIVRTLRTMPEDPEEMTRIWGEVWRVARAKIRSLPSAEREGNVAMRALPSVGSLLIQAALRVLASYQVLGGRRYPSFAANVIEMFSDIEIFVGLQYQIQIRRLRARLDRAPDDAETRLELGRFLVKCGLYDAAVEELGRTGRNPACRESALHEMAVAQYRAGRADLALRTGLEALELNPANERARAWLWLSAQKLGGYPDSVPPRHRMELRVGYATPKVEFEDVAESAGLDKTSGGRGIAIFDYDGDGRLDVMIAAAHAGCSLYRNNGDGTFSDTSIESGVHEVVNGFALAVGDYDNDGCPDIFVTRLGFLAGDGVLLRNNGDGTFSDVTRDAGLTSWGPAFSACWSDYDCDGYLDLFVAQNLGGLFDRKSPNLLFHNNGDGTFTEVAGDVGLRTNWPTIGSAWGDYNNDGYPDLFLSNAMGRSQLFRNNGDGTFTDVSREAGVDSFCIGSTTFWCDYDNDGWLDIVQFVWSDHEDMIYTMKHGHGPVDGRPLRVYRNNRDGTFTLLNREIGIDGCWGTMSGNCGDFNNDGHLDFVLGNGSPRMDRFEPLVLLENDGRGHFRNTTFAAGLPFLDKGHGANLADLFGDGRLCIIVASGGAYPGDLLTTSLYRPKVLPGNYLNVRLTGVRSNRDGVGARLCLRAGGREQYREVGGGTNFGCLPYEQHFGLAGSERVESLEIRWPSRLVQRFENLPVNQTLRIREGDPEVISLSGGDRPHEGLRRSHKGTGSRTRLNVTFKMEQA
jgi:tetratricopeptide (TPR) repeat protein